MDETAGTPMPAPDDAADDVDTSAIVSGMALRDRLPRLGAAHVDALRAFFGSPQRVPASDGGTLRLNPVLGSAPGDIAQVEGEGVRIALQFDSGIAPAHDGLQWSDYTGRARTLAWSLAHEAQLMRLSDVLGIALLPVAVEGGAVEADEDCSWLAFSIDSGHLDAAETPPACAGRMRIPSAWLHRLCARAAPSYADDPLPPLHSWLGLPARVSIRIAGPVLSGETFRTVRASDVVVAGRRSRPASIEAVFGDRAWPVSAAPGGWRVDAPAHAATSSSSFLTENAPMSSLPSTAQGEGDDAARSLPVRLEFELGQVDMSLGELAALQPGYVFNLPAHLEGANVVVRANGRTAGRGEVVAVGDTLGVRLLSWS